MEFSLPGDNNPKMPQFKTGPWLVPLIILMIVMSGAGSIFFQVGPDELGVVQRFGKYVRTESPGLHFKVPFGVETVRNVKVTHVFKEEFGFRTLQSGVRSTYTGREESPSQGSMRMRRQLSVGADPFLEESLMLTGDLNVAIVEWIVQYTVKDPVQFLFRVRDPRETIRNMSESVMRLVVGDHTINQILTSGREKIQAQMEAMLQELLDDYGSGIAIRNVILQDVTPPNEVKPSFNFVNEARQEKERLINEAWKEYNRVIPMAKGQAEQVVREAEGYAIERINRAEGDAARFRLAIEAYKKSPVVTKKRLYLETMEKVLPDVQDKLFLDERQTNLLPLLDLNPRKGGQES